MNEKRETYAIGDLVLVDKGKLMAPIQAYICDFHYDGDAGILTHLYVADKPRSPKQDWHKVPCARVSKLYDTSPREPEQLITERKSTHGDWMVQSELGFELKDRMRASTNWQSLRPHQREALDMIAVKVSRILTGNPTEPDHWDDIAGYAKLGKGGHQ